MKENFLYPVMQVPHQVRDKLRRASGNFAIDYSTGDSRLQGNDCSCLFAQKLDVLTAVIGFTKLF